MRGLLCEDVEGDDDEKALGLEAVGGLDEDEAGVVHRCALDHGAAQHQGVLEERIEGARRLVEGLKPDPNYIY